MKFVPQLTAVTELDELWKKFLATSMMGSGKENVGVAKCTCDAVSKTNTVRRKKDVEYTSSLSAMESPSPPPPRPHFSGPRTHSVLVERAVQTSPLVTHERQHQQCRLPPSSPSVMFTVASRQPARPQLSELTLSEAFALSHPEFIEASLRRQREMKQRQRFKAEQEGSRTVASREESNRPRSSERYFYFHGYSGESK